MDISHSFRFRWNDHVPQLSKAFSELRFEEVYCDTTLITEDGFVMKAHGAVLITTSGYFERVLADVTPDQHPIIVLKGINCEELSFLLDYIYRGVTLVDQHLMESVLDVADLLEIKGLSKMKNNLSLKKLLAPSVLSATEARDSPSCSSSSKSPSPLSPQSPHSPSSDVYVQSFSLKTDHEEISDDMAYESSKTRLNYVEKSVGTERSFERNEYVASTSSKHPVLSAEYLDQTLGIDLSLSRGSCEENLKNSGKNLNIQEETPLRKRKIMHSDEGPSTSEINSKFEEEKIPEGLILHQKKKVFSRSGSANGNKSSEGCVATVDDRCLPSNQLNSHKYSLEYSDKDLYSESYIDRMENYELQNVTIDTPGSEGVLKRESNVLKPNLLKCGLILQSIDVPSTSKNNINTKEKGIFLSTAKMEQSFAREDPLFIPESSEQILKIGENEKQSKHVLSVVPNVKKNYSNSAVDDSEPNEVNEPCNLQEKRFPNSSPHFIYVNPKSNISNYVAVRVYESEKLGSSTTKVDDKTQEIFKELEQRIERRSPSKVKRPLSMYTLFMKEKYQEVAEQNPDKKGPEIIKILSLLWKSISPSEKQQWKEKANKLLREFKIENPDYIYNPKKAQDEKFEYYRKKIERRNMFKINPYIPKFLN